MVVKFHLISVSRLTQVNWILWIVPGNVWPRVSTGFAMAAMATMATTATMATMATMASVASMAMAMTT